jgi:hypothetical protein
MCLHVRATIVQELSYVRQFNTMNDCQMSCLIKCASSAILDWEQNAHTKWGPTDNSYTGNTGVCTEFARVAGDLGTTFGVNVRTAFGPGHAFNSFEINGRWYYGEPQNGNCRFFTRERLDAAHLSQYEHDINGGRRVPRMFTPSYDSGTPAASTPVSPR